MSTAGSGSDEGSANQASVGAEFAGSDGVDSDVVDADAVDASTGPTAPDDVAAELRRSAIEAGRRKGGTAGAAMAGMMLALRDIYEAPPRDQDMVAVAESPGEPGDIDTEGIEVTVGDVSVWAPPPKPR